jgi:hypothetical protein
MSEEVFYAPFNIRADPNKPASILQDSEGKLWLQYYDEKGELRKVPISLVIFPQELANLAGQIPLQDFIQQIRTRIQTSDIQVPVDMQGAAIQVPIDIQGQAVDVFVRKKAYKTLAGSTTTPLAANASVTLGPFDGIDWKDVLISVFADQAGTLYYEQSPDNVNWDISEAISIAAGIGQGIVREIIARYVRVRYVNGATAQTAFRLYVWLRSI